MPRLQPRLLVSSFPAVYNASSANRLKLVDRGSTASIVLFRFDTEGLFAKSFFAETLFLSDVLTWLNRILNIRRSA